MYYHEIVPELWTVASFSDTTDPVGLDTLIDALTQLKENEGINGNANVKICVSKDSRDILYIAYGKDKNGKDTVIIFDRPDSK